MENVESLADKYQPILAPALAEFRCENFRTVARALPAIVRGYIQENEDSQTEEAGDFCKKLDALHPIERIYLLDCTVARREWPKDSSDQLAES